jgi:hypothetical protein
VMKHKQVNPVKKRINLRKPDTMRTMLTIKE